MEEWELGPDSLDPRLVYVRISVFGQDGPYSQRPGLDRLGIAYGGLLHLTGERDRPAGPPRGDHLRLPDRRLRGDGGGGRPLRPRHRVAGDEPDAARSSTPRSTGRCSGCSSGRWPATTSSARFAAARATGSPHSAPLDNYPTADGTYVCIVAGSDANFARLCRAMDRPDLLADERFSTLARRARHGDEINDLVAAWTGGQTAADVEARCMAHDVPVGTAYTAADIFADPHMAARGDLVDVDDPVVGPLRQQAPFPRFVGRPPPVPAGAPRLGADNHAVWCDLVGLSPEELDRPRGPGVI